MTVLRRTAAQLAWQQLELGMFVHVGVSTFAGCEWSDGTLPAASFAPTDLDAGQWVAVAQEMGARYLVLTAKHHDGFCLWPTATTDYSVASSPWRWGRGDLVEDGDRRTWRARLPGPVRLDHLRLREDYRDSQRVERHVVRHQGQVLAEGLTVGQQRVHAVPAVTAAVLEVETVGAGAQLRALEVFDTRGATVPEPGYAASTDEPER